MIIPLDSIDYILYVIEQSQAVILIVDITVTVNKLKEVLNKDYKFHIL